MERGRDIKGKKAMEMAITTLVVIVLGILILMALTLALTGGFDKLMKAIRGYSGSDIDNLKKICESQCLLENKDSFCCGEKFLGKENVTCLDKRVKIECSVNCEDVCGK